MASLSSVDISNSMTRQHQYVGAAPSIQDLIPQTLTLSSPGAMPGGGMKLSRGVKVLRTGQGQPPASPAAGVRAHGMNWVPAPLPNFYSSQCWDSLLLSPELYMSSTTFIHPQDICDGKTHNRTPYLTSSTTKLSSENRS